MSRKKKKSEYICFADMEFHCNRKQEKGYDHEQENEIISIGLVFVNQNTRKVERTYYSTIRPKYNRKLTADCRKLTGLTQKEIDRSADFNGVMQDILNVPVKYDKVYVFGNDRAVFKKEMRRHPDLPGIAAFSNKITNIENMLSLQTFGAKINIGLAGYKELLGMEGQVAHHALADAMDLFQVWKAVQENNYSDEERERLLKEYKAKQKYYMERRFHTKRIPDDFIGKNSARVQKQAEELVQIIYAANESQIVDPIVLAAFCDDLLKLVGKEPNRGNKIA